MGIHVTATHPGALARDPYLWQVRVVDDAIRWPLILRYRRWDDDETPGKVSWLLVGFELEDRHKGRAQEEWADSPFDAAVIRPGDLAEVAARLDYYHSIAVGWLEFDFAGANQRALELQARGRGRRGLGDDFLKIVVGDYRGLVAKGKPGIAELARAYNVNRSTASRWIKKAAERGLLAEGEEQA